MYLTVKTSLATQYYEEITKVRVNTWNGQHIETLAESVTGSALLRDVILLLYSLLKETNG